MSAATADRRQILDAARHVLINAAPGLSEVTREAVARNIATRAAAVAPELDADTLRRLKDMAATLESGAPAITVASFKQMAWDIGVLLYALGEGPMPRAGK